MANIYITDKTGQTNNLNYVKNTLSELFYALSVGVDIKTEGARDSMTLTIPDDYFTTVQVEVADKLAEIIAISYKYAFFKDKVHVSGLTSLEKELLTLSLISADFEEDKGYAFTRLKNESIISLDGMYNFRLKALKKKWCEIVDCMPTCFMKSQLKDFIGFLIETRKNVVYVDNKKVYDTHYRRLRRTDLLENREECPIIKEILLSDGGRVEITGDIEKEDEEYLKEFFVGKISLRKDFRYIDG